LHQGYRTLKGLFRLMSKFISPFVLPVHYPLHSVRSKFYFFINKASHSVRPEFRGSKASPEYRRGVLIFISRKKKKNRRAILRYSGRAPHARPSINSGFQYFDANFIEKGPCTDTSSSSVVNALRLVSEVACPELYRRVEVSRRTKK
jgi:hypothetical protein